MQQVIKWHLFSDCHGFAVRILPLWYMCALNVISETYCECSRIPFIWMLMLWKSWYLAVERKSPTGGSPFKSVSTSTAVVPSDRFPPTTSTSFNYEDSQSTVSWSFSIPGISWRDFKSNRKGPWSPAPATEGHSKCNPPLVSCSTQV